MKLIRILIISLFFFTQSYGNKEIVTLKYMVSAGTVGSWDTVHLSEEITLNSGDYAKVVRFSTNEGLRSEITLTWTWRYSDNSGSGGFSQDGFIYVYQNGIRSTAYTNDIINGPATIRVGFPSPIRHDHGQPSITATRDNFVVADILITRAPNPQPAAAATIEN
jgi:hypothetical protein